MNDPIQIFESWFANELAHSSVAVPSACCLSTLGLDGFPNARFVSLKNIVNGTFVITGALDTQKGREMVHHSHVALTFWWSATRRQVRIQGVVSRIPSKNADQYFSERSREAQIVSILFNQGEEIENLEKLKVGYKKGIQDLGEKPLLRPENWGGISIAPIRIEFMEFSASRLHERTLFKWDHDRWSISHLQP